MAPAVIEIRGSVPLQAGMARAVEVMAAKGRAGPNQAIGFTAEYLAREGGKERAGMVGLS